MAMQRVGRLFERMTDRCIAFSKVVDSVAARSWKYAKVEMRPPRLEELPQVKQGVNNIIVGAKTQKFMRMPVKEVMLNTLVCVEIFGVFCIGECIGKGTLVGYFIPGAWSMHGEDSRKMFPRKEKNQD